MTINKHYFITKSGQVQHTRTSKTGKVYTAGSGSTSITESEIKQRMEEINKDPKKYAKFFHIEGMKDDLKSKVTVDDRVRNPDERERIAEKKEEAIDDLTPEQTIAEWFDTFENDEAKIKEELDFAAENSL